MAPTPLQHRKYLCQAPRPEKWAHLVEGVLRSLGRTTSAEAQLQLTLQKVQALHQQHQQPRTGPGRKSNAEHAIHFYEYLLQQLQLQQSQKRKSAARKQKGSADDDDDDTIEDEQRSIAENEAAQEGNDHGGAAEEVKDDDGDMKMPAIAAAAAAIDSGDEEDHAGHGGGGGGVDDDDDDELVSMDTPTFCAQHNDSCDVCDEAGELLMCSTCNLVFHHDCVRPKPVAAKNKNKNTSSSSSSNSSRKQQQSSSQSSQLDRNWRCSYCILQTNIKKNSRERRRAAAAVRLMARLRKRHERRHQQQQQHDDTVVVKDDDGRDEAAVNEEEGEVVGEKAPAAPFDAQEHVSEEGDDIESLEKPKPEVKGPPAAAAGTEEEEQAAAMTTEKEESNNKACVKEPPVEIAVPKFTTKVATSNSEHVQTTLAAVTQSSGAAAADESKPAPTEASEGGGGTRRAAASAATSDATKEKKGSPERTTTPKTTTGADESAVATTGTLGDKSNNKKRAAAAAATSDSPPPGELLSSPEGRSKRCRKQPTLYDPQKGPASRWQTDELKEWKASRTETTDESDGDEKQEHDNRIDASTKDPSMAPVVEDVKRPTKMVPADEPSPASARKAARERSDGVWCSFCKDDPDVPVCVFCACRVCFGKHSQTKLLLCDRCDEEYHTFCLDPPLDTVPDAKQWYCPSCTTSSKSSASPRSARRSVDEQRTVSAIRSSSRERAAPAVVSDRMSTRTPSPSKRAAVVPKANSEPKKVSSDNKKHVVDRKHSSGRPRGRPPKILPAAATATTTTLDEDDPQPQSTPGSRKRGRPPSKMRAGSEPPRKRGRPPSAATLVKRAKAEAEARKAARLEAKSSSKAGSFASKKVGDGMPSSTPFVRETSLDDSASDAAAAARPVLQITVSRSGRMVRRSSFHDEVHEGAQHLKSGRYADQRLASDSNPESFNYDFSAKAPPGQDTLAVDAEMADPSAILGPRADHGQVSAASTAFVDGVSSNLAAAAARSFAQAKTPGLLSNELSPTVQQQLKSPPSTDPTNMNAAAAHLKKTSALGFQPIHAASVASTTPSFSATGAMRSVAAGPQSAASATSAQGYAQSAYASRGDSKQPRRKPGARECMQISRRFGVKEIPQHYVETLIDYCTRGKVEHLIRMRERLDEHSRFLESQLAGLEALVLEHGESDIVVPLAPPSPDRRQD